MSKIDAEDIQYHRNTTMLHFTKKQVIELVVAIDMSMKREAIICVLLVIVMAPALVQAAAPAQENDIRPLDDLDIWVDQLSWYNYYWTYLYEDDEIHVSFEVTFGMDIDFFICDGENYDLWIDGQSSIAYRIADNVGSYSTIFTVPSDGEWHIVFSNDDRLFRKHIEGTIKIQYPAPPSDPALGILVSGILICLILGIAAVFHHMRKRTKTRKDVPHLGGPGLQGGLLQQSV